jgi:hypothetical protein
MGGASTAVSAAAAQGCFGTATRAPSAAMVLLDFTGGSKHGRGTLRRRSSSGSSTGVSTLPEAQLASATGGGRVHGVVAAV